MDRLENREAYIISDSLVYSLAPNQSKRVTRKENNKQSLNQSDIWKKDLLRTSSYRKQLNQSS
ncbi:hypothetical protein HN992_03140 [Candidatus Woesearchaeota archaeon]|nr:hypothetical protein [Candidatus Woesearchaeota archaeon]MBT3438946.1 hypothetical protein [Candidatus Woesearchaeota archaeon]MBT4057963.1 hypothetical protein [Candidatus Woesearchaeota archaeon]MBT4733342.1 hypothetical protein [Candidatus Woesearchaeota archaeon]MBT4783551.1 hypothetical protein [Candidatus Woesearchaeota archaeon]